MKNQFISKDKASLAELVAQHIIQVGREQIESKGKFSLALSGGSTPKGLYELLASDAFKDRLDWSKVYFFFGDERTVPPDHDQSNYKMAKLAMFDALKIEEDHIFRMKGELPPQEAAAQYAESIDRFFGEEESLDYTLLGMGDDGHTASLFPHTTVLQVFDRTAAALEVPKLNTWRISLTIPFLRKSKIIAMLIAGAGKTAMLKTVLEGPYQPEEYPIQSIFHSNPKVLWFLDEAAVG